MARSAGLPCGRLHLRSGAAPAADLQHWFHCLGAITARLHRHAATWQRPSGFARRRWDAAAMFGPGAVWGSWRAAAGLGASDVALLERGVATITEKLAQFGTGADRFGLIHADLRLTNLLADGERLRVIDFDDCGFGWRAYDFAAAVSFLEDSPSLPALLDAWLAGYGSFPRDQLWAMPVLVAARRVLLTAWLASHPGGEPVGPDFTAGTLRVVDDLLHASQSAIGPGSATWTVNRPLK